MITFFDFVGLPDELRMYVLSFLGEEDLTKSVHVSRAWKDSVDDDQLWRILNLKTFGKYKGDDECTWKQFVKENIMHRKSFNDNTLDTLLWACESGHDTLVRWVFKTASDSISLRKKNKLLLKAAYKGHKDVVEILLAQGAQIEAATKSGFTALHMACGKGHAEVVQALLKLHSCIEARNKNGSTPLHTAAQKGHVAVVECLLAADPPADIEAANNNGVRPLNSAAHKGHLHVVKVLIKNGAELDAANKNGITPLYSAAHRGHFEIVQTLLEHKANIEGTTKNHGATPLYISAQEGYLEIVELLLSHNANVEAKIYSGLRGGATALYTAAHRGHASIVDLLIKSGADPQTPDKLGFTPLHKAAAEGHLACVEALLKAGANTKIKASDNTTAYDVAHKSVKRVLKPYANSDQCLIS